MKKMHRACIFLSTTYSVDGLQGFGVLAVESGVDQQGGQGLQGLHAEPFQWLLRQH